MIAGLILAAGESSRMGSDKALLPYRGRTFLETIIGTLRDAGVERIAVVLGHHAEEIRRAANIEGVRVVLNRGYQRGQTTSLQAGLRTLSRPKPEGIVLCLVDHPAVSAGTIEKLIAAFRQSPSPVVTPAFQGRRGHPVLIGRPLFEELLSLGPESGANLVIRRHSAEIQSVEVEDAGVLFDVDDPEIYRQLPQ